MRSIGIRLAVVGCVLGGAALAGCAAPAASSPPTTSSQPTASSEPAETGTLTPTGPARTADRADARLLRLTNDTGSPLAGVTVQAGGGPVRYGPLAPGESSGYQDVPGDLYQYAAIQADVADGTTLRLTPIDFVGETPLGPGRYTFVLARSTDRADRLALHFVPD